MSDSGLEFTPEDYLGTKLVSLTFQLLINLVGPTRRHLATQVEDIVREHSRIQRMSEFQPPPEAKFVDNRIIAEPRGPMILDSPFGILTTPSDVNIDEMNCSSHIQPYIKFVGICYFIHLLY